MLCGWKGNCRSGITNSVVNRPIFVNYSRLNVRKHFFAERVVSVWNNLECDIINFSSLRSFKQSLMMCHMSKYVKT